MKLLQKFSQLTIPLMAYRYRLEVWLPPLPPVFLKREIRTKSSPMGPAEHDEGGSL